MKSTSSQREIWADRRAAAMSIFSQLAMKQPEIAKRTHDVDLLCDVSLGWATYGIKDDQKYAKKSEQGRSFSLPRVDGLKILKLTGPGNGRSLDAPHNDCTYSIDLTMKYENCAWFNHFDTVFYTAGGINLPKITTCFDTKGNPYKQLVRFL